jgi:carbon storage regulator
MLVLVRYVNDRIMIGDDIVITITDVNRKSGRVKVGIEAPNDVRVDREEIRIAKNKNKNGVQNV